MIEMKESLLLERRNVGGNTVGMRKRQFLRGEEPMWRKPHFLRKVGTADLNGRGTRSTTLGNWEMLI